jgi:MinD superfamily P-loop ATPase
MREILVISGKGGTGKTSLAAAFAHLASGHVICDLDVDAPDLHLLLHPDRRHAHPFHSGAEAAIDPARCTACGTCLEMCRFDAIRPAEPSPVVDPLMCEGCKVCVHFCPAGAIDFPSRHCGTWYESETRFGPMIHAQLFPGQENSGRLVALLRHKAKETASALGKKLILADGSPGIGCPVISSLSGVHLAVIVTEPTPSGRHDMDRIVGLCAHFSIPVAVVINKCDLNPEMSRLIGTECRRAGLALAAEIPYDPVFVHAMVKGRTVTEFTDGRVAARIREAWSRIVALADAE